MPVKLKGIFFDLYGTLLLYGDMRRAWDDWLAVLHDSLRHSGLTLSRDSLAANCDGFFSKPEPPSRDDGLSIFERRIADLYSSLDLRPEPDSVRNAAAASLNAWHKHVTPDPDARPVLGKLHKKLTLALITNFDHPSHVYKLLTDIELAEMFSAVVISGDEGVRKPDPAIFEKATESTGLQPSEVMYVGDSVEHDIAGARAAGLQPVLIQRRNADESTRVLDFETGRKAFKAQQVDSETTGLTVITRLTELIEIVERSE